VTAGAWWVAGDGVLLPPAEMAAVDRATIRSGIPGPRLMENAGRGLARAIVRRFPPQPLLVLCGPGNNGGDGWVVARILRDAGWPVRLASLVDPASLKGDAAWARSTWDGPVLRLGPALVDGPDLLVDALFGAGLARDLDGLARAVVERAAAAGRISVAVDIPSGIDGTTGAVRGATLPARLTVTFARAKPGHLLLPGRSHVGELVVHDIGIPDAIVAAHDPGLRVNAPARWLYLVPRRAPEGHKYRYGHALVAGAPPHATGATRLAATAALRVGAGLVSVASAPESVAAYAAQLTTVMVKRVDDAAAWQALLADVRFNALLIGPAAGVGEGTRRRVSEILATGRPAVLDADALTSFADDPAALLGMLHGSVVLTPHDGEHARLFAHRGDRLARARAAAAEAGAVILLKGADTVVAAPDGRAVIQPEATPRLATAGTGDVLAGLVLGLLAQGMPAFEAAAAAVWLHARCAAALGPGMIAEDLPSAIPQALASLFPPHRGGPP
jgi:NAD(P)H-hydrate epimerase